VKIKTKSCSFLRKKKSGRKIDPKYNDDEKENIFPQITSQKQTFDLGRKKTNIGEIKLKFLVKMGTQVLITHVTKYTWAGGISSFLFPPFLLVSEYQFHTGVDL
jgi:hypothetical protein